MLKTGPIFFFFLFFCFWKSHSPCRKKRIFQKQPRKNKKNDPFLALKTGPILLRNIIGPVFNASLDQFLTLGFLFFFVFFFFFFLAETPIFIVFSAKNAKFKETQKKKKDTICEHNCANCSCENVLFFVHFSFLLFFQYPFFLMMFLNGFPKSKNTKKNKASKT